MASFQGDSSITIMLLKFGISCRTINLRILILVTQLVGVQLKTLVSITIFFRNVVVCLYFLIINVIHMSGQYLLAKNIIGHLPQAECMTCLCLNHDALSVTCLTSLFI